VSVVLHELTHGLGFTGLLNSYQGRGSYGYGSDALPSVFDHHIINKDQQYLVNKTLFPNPSVTLNIGLTSGWLEFYTQLAESTLPRLYAPVTFDEGSSLYHLDDATYPAGNANSLMTPFTGMGEKIHHPGPDALAIMYEMGWRSISIRHNPLKDIETGSTPVDFTAIIDSDNELDFSKLYLVYSTSRFSKTDSVLLKPTGTPGSFSVTLSQFKSGQVDYFFSAADVFGRRFVFPSNSPHTYLSFRIGADRQLPVVKHEPVKFMLSSSPSARVEAKVTDNLGVKSVSIEYIINGGTLQRIAMQPVSNDLYSADFTLPEGSVKGGEKVSYRIVATDASQQANVGRLPFSGYNTFIVETIKTPSEKYNNNFNNTLNDFIGTDFFLSTPAGFASRGLNSSHPYPSPDADNMEYNYTTILRNPILLKPGGIMSYDEIVLVEPADPGITFGDEDFWDYVIVEGSKDGGKTWMPLIDGYDSNSSSSWLDLYHSSTSGNNSTAVPTNDHFVRRQFQLTGNGNFAPGDVILIRFRLFSDPYSHGWGWIIDNLSIQDMTTSANSPHISSGEVMVYPNPVTDQLHVSVESKNMPGKLILKVYNASGTVVFNQHYAVGVKGFHQMVDVRNFAPGLYLIAVEAENGQKITRKILVQ
ncbi:MAG TPA: T9SS type A sorting domain-containing protein, partial [Prolixibacteraceae bacterium]|nr:T9SS type A sorting domain-containing protein [Prolixibacteraceae bacterium]